MSPSYPRFAALTLGASASVTRVYSAAEVESWRGLANAPEGGSELPEPLIAALFSQLLGERLPGHGTNYLKQHMEFEAPARVSEPLTARVTISRLRPEKALVNLETVCTGEGGRTICRGQALVLFQC